MAEKKIRVGVVGVGRGMSFAGMAEQVGMELVALCDTWEEKLRQAGQRCGVATYTDYEEFLGHDLDAVILANYYHDACPIRDQGAGGRQHVMSECIACKTLGEGVALARAVGEERPDHFFAENYATSTTCRRCAASTRPARRRGPCTPRGVQPPRQTRAR